MNNCTQKKRGYIRLNTENICTEQRTTKPFPLKVLLIPIFLLLVFFAFTTKTSAAEEFTASSLELSGDSSKDIEFTVKADSRSVFWAANFTINFDSDIFTFKEISADQRLDLDYTIKKGSITILLHRDAASDVTLQTNDTILTLKFRVSDKIQPGEYSLSFSYPKSSMVTYGGTSKNMHIKGGTVFYGNKVTYVSKGNVISSDFATAGDTLYPSNTMQTSNPDEIFIGWFSKKNSQHKKIFIAPGESFVLGNYDVTLEAVFLEIKTLPGASVYFAKEDNDVRLRYISAVNKEQYDYIYNTILGKDAASIILGTLICPTQYVESNADINNNGGMNFDALKNDRLAVQTSVPKAPGQWLSSSDLGGINASDKYYYYDGILNNIIRDDSQQSGDDKITYDTGFSASTYLTITYPSGTTIDYFAKYDPTYHSRSVSYVVNRALSDTSTTQTNYYKFKIDDVYRPYSSSQIEALYRLKAHMQ